jgi:hypothetical protein
MYLRAIIHLAVIAISLPLIVAFAVIIETMGWVNRTFMAD